MQQDSSKNFLTEEKGEVNDPEPRYPSKNRRAEVDSDQEEMEDEVEDEMEDDDDLNQKHESWSQKQELVSQRPKVNSQFLQSIIIIITYK